MGTTKTAMQAGSIASVFVVAIEGYDKLLTNHGDRVAVADAWAVTDWNDKSNVLAGCLFVDLKNELRIHPWEPFQSGGTCQLTVHDAGEEFSIAVARTAGGNETGVTSTVTRTSSSVNVGSTASFASSGEAFIGNERFSYSSTSSTAFVVSQRGRYSPFSNCEVDPTHFPRHVQVGTPDLFGTSKLPLVTDLRRDWDGAWIGVWEHRVVNGVLDTRAEAQLVYAGQIDGTTGAEDGGTIINLRHVFDVIADSTVFLDQYRADIAPSCYVGTSDFITISDAAGGTGNHVYVLQVAAVASLPYTIAAGRYSVDDILDFLNAALAALRLAGTIPGSHSFTRVGSQVYDTHAYPLASSTATCATTIDGKGGWISFLGGTVGPSIGGTVHTICAHSVVGPDELTYPLPNPVSPVRVFSDQVSPALDVSNEQGTFINNGGDLLPAEYSGYWDGSSAIGFFIVDDKALICGRISGGQLLDARWIMDSATASSTTTTGEITGTSIKQVWIMTRAWWQILAWFFNSTGDVGYNTPEYDVLPYGLGLEIPNELLAGPLGDLKFVNDARSTQFSGYEGTIWIRKPTKLIEVLLVDLVLRMQYLSWKDGALRLATWQSLLAANATMVLGESNKAEPAGNIASHFAVTTRDNSLAKPIVKVQFDYDPIADEFNGPEIVLYDRIAVANGSKDPITLAWKNGGQGDHAANLIKLILSLFEPVWAKYLSRPMSTIRRSIDQRYFEGYAPGEVVVFDDKQARDPLTGRLGVVARPGLLLRHAYGPGGLRPGDGEGDVQVGEVDIFVDASRDALWSPAAEVDETFNTGGYTAGYSSSALSLVTKSHEHSDASEALDAASFATGDVVLITEIDPAMGTAPDQWTRTLSSVVGGSVFWTVGGALASPAFSSTKRYRITSAAYASAAIPQKTDAYQADDADGLIQNLASPFHYGVTGPGITPADLAHTELCELDPTGVSAGDGVAFDTGFHLGLAKTANNLIDHKTAVQGASLSSTVMVFKGSAPWFLVELRRRYFGAGQTSLAKRALAVAPWMRSTTGTSTVRVTLARTKPSIDALGNAVFFGSYSQKTFSSSSATWGAAAEQLLDLAYIDTTGVGWIAIEVSANAQTRGLAQCIVRERT